MHQAAGVVSAGVKSGRVRTGLQRSQAVAEEVRNHHGHGEAHLSERVEPLQHRLPCCAQRWFVGPLGVDRRRPLGKMETEGQVVNLDVQPLLLPALPLVPPDGAVLRGGVGAGEMEPDRTGA